MEMNINNPFSEFVLEMRKHGAYNNPTTFELGQVVSSSPLTIKVGDLQLTQDDILVADYLLNNYSRQLQVNGTTQNYITQDGLNKGDLLVLIQVNSATYIIMARLVSLT